MLINQNLLKSFCKYLTSMLQKKQKFIKVNNSNFATKNVRKAIAKRSKLRNKYLRVRTNEATSLCNKQRNLYVSILRKNKRGYFGNLNNKIFTENRRFWKTISPLFSEEIFHRECITLKKVIK